MSLIRIANQIYNRPWLIIPATHQSMVSQFENYLQHGSKADIVSDNNAEDVAPDPYTITGNTMVIEVSGIIGKRLSLIESLCGGYDLTCLTQNIKDALVNPAVQNVIVHFNTPGGTVTGTPEAATLIKQLSAVKNTIAYTDTLCASAGYWLASSCKYFYAAPSADVGSVGVYRLVVDATEAYKKDGIKVDAISAGKYKLSGADFKPMTAEERQMMQDEVNATYNQFVSWVKENRPNINLTELPLAKVYSGEDAAGYGFTDGTVNDVEDLIAFVNNK